ncbi:DUF3392 domain-containing protein [Hydrogenovibrio sp. SC-1]|uniref:DUF3392 domain-containing protein n=1 Tax=Hydrogenovibrio sp. SC-1 TaxID=2065820 RepID=UPI000C79B84F|nr:DUF3392 domain-containing protein [Hydrogenovibrio sp. SC-1]PLA75441.1 DUF3392 domain-containing protein [Hydrogenovibrio sp. SC-1]
MEFILDWIGLASQWMRPHLSDIGMAMIATLLVIFGYNMTQLLKLQIGRYHFAVKITLFVVFCAFGFAILAKFAAPLLTAQLASISDNWLAPIVVATFYGIGWIAQKKQMI